MSDNVDVNIQEPITVVVEVYVDVNASTLLLIQMQNLIDTFSIRDTIITDAGFDKDGQNFTANEVSVWNINGVNYSNAEEVDILIPLTSEGMHRWDRIVLTTTNTFELVSGDEVILADEPALPILPINTLEYTLFKVTDAEVGDMTSPNIGDYFIKKSFAKSFAYSSLTGENAVVPLPPNGESTIILNNPGLVSVAGFDLSLITGNSSAEVPFSNKVYRLENQTPNSIVLKHLGAALIGVFIRTTESDLIIPPGEFLYLDYGISTMETLIKSWSNQSDRVYVNLISNIAITSGNENWWNIGNAANGTTGNPFVNSGTTDLLLSINNNVLPHFKAVRPCKLKSVSIDFINAGGGKYHLGIVKGKFVSGSAFYGSTIADKIIIFENVIFNNQSADYQKGYFEIIPENLFSNNFLEEGDCIFICLWNSTVQNGAAGKNTIITVEVENL